MQPTRKLDGLQRPSLVDVGRWPQIMGRFTDRRVAHLVHAFLSAKPALRALHPGVWQAVVQAIHHPRITRVKPSTGLRATVRRHLVRCASALRRGLGVGERKQPPPAPHGVRADIATSAARTIVAQLLLRERSARRSLKRAIQAGASAEAIDREACFLAEAHNAAEAARRILNRGTASL